jgi:hypothetical protein
MILFDPFLHQMFLKQMKQQVGFSAATHSGYDLNKPVAFFADQPIEVLVSFDFHMMRPFC